MSHEVALDMDVTEMHGMQRRFILAMVLAWAACSVQAQVRNPEMEPGLFRSPPGNSVTKDIIEVLPETQFSNGAYEIHVPGASFVKLHFSQFNLPAGLVVEVSSPDGEETYRYSTEVFDSHTIDREIGDDGQRRFYAMSITGDRALVRVTGNARRFDPGIHGVQIDSFIDGFPLSDSVAGAEFDSGIDSLSKTNFSCGADERYDGACFKDSHPGEYDRTIPIAVLITSRGEKCTAWRVGPDNRMFTAQHCISSQSDLDGSEIWFNYAATSCGSSSLRDEVKVTGDQLLASDYTLDYALFSVNDFSSITKYGYIGLDTRNGSNGESIFIPQHGLAQPRQLALESDMNVSGYCEIDDANFTGFASGSDIGYYCDTTTSSSGSPVISGVTGKAIALHHLGGCLNSGTKVSLIWPQVKSFFNGVPPDGDIPWDNFGSDNEIPAAVFDTDCSSLVCSFDATASFDSDGSITDYRWELSDGGTASGETLQYEFAKAGTYQVTLEVEDDSGAKGIKNKTVSVQKTNSAPNASFSSSCIELSCTFNATNSYDEDGDVVSWNWSLGDGESASGKTLSYVYSAAGNYSVRLTVRDNDGASDDTSRSITLNEHKNEHPVAAFTVDCDDLSCSVNASTSHDPDGTISSFAWDFGDGEAATGMTRTHNFAGSGSFTITLTVEDNEGSRGVTSRNVIVNEPVNEEPVADFSVDCDGLSCSLNAGASVDPDGNISRFVWDFGDGESSQVMNPTHQYGAGGSFTIKLTVEDDQGATDTTSRLISVEKPNAKPVADFTFDCDQLSCIFDAGSSFDSDGTILGFEWQFDDGSRASGKIVSHTYTQPGSYQVALVVEDQQGASDNRLRTVVVTRPESKPIAEFFVSCDELSCSLDAGVSKAGEGEIALYEWSFGDGTTGTGKIVEHRYASGGRYSISLRVTDTGQSTGERSRTVEINKKPEIVLAVSGRFQNNRLVGVMTWTGAESETVRVMRDGSLVASTANSGKYIDGSIMDMRKTARYQVCEATANRCSQEVTVQFGH